MMHSAHTTYIRRALDLFTGASPAFQASSAQPEHLIYLTQQGSWNKRQRGGEEINEGVGSCVMTRRRPDHPCICDVFLAAFNFTRWEPDMRLGSFASENAFGAKSDGLEPPTFMRQVRYSTRHGKSILYYGKPAGNPILLPRHWISLCGNQENRRRYGYTRLRITGRCKLSRGLLQTKPRGPEWKRKR